VVAPGAEAALQLLVLDPRTKRLIARAIRRLTTKARARMSSTLAGLAIGVSAAEAKNSLPVAR